MSKHKFQKLEFTGILFKINKSSCVIEFNNFEAHFVMRYKDVKDNRSTFIARKKPIKFYDTKVGDKIILTCLKKFRNGRLSIVPIEVKKFKEDYK